MLNWRSLCCAAWLGLRATFGSKGPGGAGSGSVRVWEITGERRRIGEKLGRRTLLPANTPLFMAGRRL
jgi:hypothetical protein